MSAETKNINVTGPKGFWYIILAAVTVLVLVFSFVSYYAFPAPASAGFDLTEAKSIAGILDTERNIYTEGAVLENRTVYTKGLEIISSELYNINGLTKVNARRASLTADKTSASQKITADLAGGPSFVIQDFAQNDIDYTIDAQTVRAMRQSRSNVANEDLIVASRQVKNIIVDIPGTSTAEDKGAVLFMTHYDSAYESNGAMSAAASAAMIATIKDIIVGHKTFENDLVFVFTEGRYENSVGAYAFYNQFIGFDNVASRIKVGFNFDALTSGGALTIVQAAEGYGNVYAAAQNASGAKSAYGISGMLDGSISSDIDIFYNCSDEEWDVPAVNFMMSAGKYDAGSQYDTGDAAAEAVSQYAGAMAGLVRAFGNADINYSKSIDGSSAGIFGLSFGIDGIFLIILAVLSLLLAGGYIFYGIKSGDVNLKSIAKGTAMVLLTGAFVTGIEYGLYFLISLLVAAIGGFTYAQVFTNIVLTPLVLIPYLLIAVGVSCGTYSAFKGLLRVKSKDCVKGVFVLFVLAGFILTFAYPRLALPFILTGIILTLVNFVVLLLKKNNEKKGKNYPFGKLFISYLAASVILGGFIDLALIITNTFGSIFLPLMMLPVSILLSTITPYFTKMSPVLENAFENLPKHKIRVVKEVTSTIEDPVKKGRFTEVKEVKTVEEKVAWKYSNRVGVSIIMTVAVVALFICSIISSYAVPVGKNVTNDLFFVDSGIDKTFYDDTIVFYKDLASTGSYKLKIKDSQLYRKLRYLEGYDYWNWTYDEKTKEYSRTISASNPISGTISISNEQASEGIFPITPYYGTESTLVLDIRNISSGDTITVEKQGEIDFTYKCSNPAKVVRLTLPYGYGGCTLKVDTESTASIGVSEYITNTTAINNDAKEKMEEMQEFFDRELGEGVVKFAYVIVMKT